MRKMSVDKRLKELAHVLAEKMKTNISIDWTIRKNVKAKLKVIVKRILRKHVIHWISKKMTVDRILKQSGLFAEIWTGSGLVY